MILKNYVKSDNKQTEYLIRRVCPYVQSYIFSNEINTKLSIRLATACIQNYSYY